MSLQNDAKREFRQLKAIKDFTADDTCFNDGAKPLSFQLGDVFTLLGYRDKHWANVERIICNNNSILKIETYPPTERGIVPRDYVLEMDTRGSDDSSANQDQNGSDKDSLPECQDDEAMKVTFMFLFYPLLEVCHLRFLLGKCVILYCVFIGRLNKEDSII